MIDNYQFTQLTTRVDLLEHPVQFLLDQIKIKNNSISPGQLYPDVVALKRKGNLLEAIKPYRSYTNASLVEAKMIIENMQ